MTFSYIRISICALLLGTAVGCGAPSLPYHGFQSSNSLSSADDYVLKESIGGKMDPLNMSQEDQRYAHDGIAYDRKEEGYYQWGMKMYQLGYRDIYYIRDLEPRAFKQTLLDTFEKAIDAGYDAAQSQASKQ